MLGTPPNWQFNEAQRSLERLGNSPFYATPNTPADPRDCDRYPNSIWCGNDFYSDNFIGIETELVLDECNIGIQASATLGFISLPTFQFVYRFEECRLPPPPIPPDEVGTVYVPPPQGSGVYVFFSSGYFYREEIDRWEDEPHIKIGEDWNHSIDESRSIYPISDRFPGYFQAEISLSNSGKYYLIEIDEETENNREVSTSRNYNQIVSNRKLDPRTTEQESNDFVFGILASSFFQNRFDIITGVVCFSYKSALRWATYDIAKNRKNTRAVEQIYGIQDGYYQEFEIKWEVLELGSSPFPPPPPPPPKRCKCMCCCNNDNSLLRLLLNKVNKIYNTVGVDDYPVSVPQWITKNDSPQTSIANITRFISYTIKQLDAISGNYPIKIKIQDADLTQEGNQEKTVTLPNAAEALAEIVGLLLTIRSETNASLIASVNGMIEAGSAKQLAFLAQEYAQANAEFLAYKGKQVERELPFTFKPNEPQLDKMMNPSTVKVKGWENDDKNDFTDAIAPLLELAAMWKAQNFRNTGAASPIETLGDILRGASNISAAMSELRKNPPVKPNPDGSTPPQEPKKDDWDQFLEDTEQGFIGKPGITDNTHPYSRPLQQRPRIKEIGDDTSDSNDGNN